MDLVLVLAIVGGNMRMRTGVVTIRIHVILDVASRHGAKSGSGVVVPDNRRTTRCWVTRAAPQISGHRTQTQPSILTEKIQDDHGASRKTFQRAV